MTFEITIDGRKIAAEEFDTILSAADRAGIELPHLCACDRVGYEPIAACRTCLVEIEGEAALAPACRRAVEPDMAIVSESERVERVRRLVLELTVSQMSMAAYASQSDCSLSRLLHKSGVEGSRFGFDPDKAPADRTHPAIVFDAESCIRCGLCRSACHDVQNSGVIAMAGMGDRLGVTFDLGLALSESSCVSCGECMQVCPTGALRPAAIHQADGGPAEVERRAETICPFCSVGCRVELQIAQDRVLFGNGADGPANHGRLCVKGRFGFDFLSHPERLQTPLVRRENAPKDPSANLAAAGIVSLFREASWEEALERAATGFLKIKEGFGSGALAALASGKASNEDAYVLQRLVRTGFGTNNVDHCTRLCASVPPMTEATGLAAVSAPIEEAAYSDVILMVGSNPEVNHPVGATFIKNAVRRGAKLILVDPYRQPMARFAAVHLPTRPGTDFVLLSAMTRVVIEENLFDEAAVRERIEGFDALRQRVAPYTLDVASRICGAPGESIAAAAGLFACSRAAMTFWGMGASQHTHGANNIRAVIALALICGQFGRRGAGLHPLRGQNNVQGSCDAGAVPMYLPGYGALDDAALRDRLGEIWGAPPPRASGLTQMEILEAAGSGRIRGLYVVGANPAMTNPNLAATRKALAALDHLIVQDLFPTETAAFADVILPAAALAERCGTVTNTDRYIQLLAPAVPAPGAARPDWEITRDLASRMGLSWSYRSVGDVFDEMTRINPILWGFSWSRIVEARSLQYPLRDGRESCQSLFAETFPRAGGRAYIAAFDEAQPHFLPNADYPFVLITGRLREHLHSGSMTRRSHVLEDLSHEPFVHLAPFDFERLRLSEDEKVAIETPRGRVEMRPRSDERMQSGAIWMAMSFIEAAANELTSSHLDPTTRVPEYKYCAARVSRT
jgi:formate dehydrogenase major subunit